jgi:hypothetical protein
MRCSIEQFLGAYKETSLSDTRCNCVIFVCVVCKCAISLLSSRFTNETMRVGSQSAKDFLQLFSEMIPVKCIIVLDLTLHQRGMRVR